MSPIRGIMSGERPDITPLQLVGALVTGVPILANLLRVFGVYDLNDEQIEALKESVKWGALSALFIFGSDTLLRGFRNLRQAKVEVASFEASKLPPDSQVTVVNTGEAEPPQEASTFTGESARDLVGRGDDVNEESELSRPRGFVASEFDDDDELDIVQPGDFDDELEDGFEEDALHPPLDAELEQRDLHDVAGGGV